MLFPTGSLISSADSFFVDFFFHFLAFFYFLSSFSVSTVESIVLAMKTMTMDKTSENLLVTACSLR
jgi:hypothetical protein